MPWHPAPSVAALALPLLLACAPEFPPDPTADAPEATADAAVPAAPGVTSAAPALDAAPTFQPDVAPEDSLPGAGAGLDARIAALADARTPNSPSDAGAPTDARSPTDAPPPAIPVTTRELTDGWMDAVFGPTTRNGPTKPGAAVVTGNRMKVTGYGSGLVGKEQLGRESFYFLWKPLVGDGEVSAKIVSSTHEHSADVGVMIRAGLTPMSFHGMAGVQPTDDTVDVYSAAHFRRYEISTAGVLPRLTKGLRLPLWVKAVRSGQTITAYVSTDGTAWRSLGAQTYQDFPREAYAGIAVMSGWTRATAPTTAELEDVSLVQR